MTISFLTLFFGLISGPFPVQMAVSGPAAAVEVTLDGGAPIRLTAPPWSTTLDFGPGLLPHRVVARALDAEGHELARSEEWANFPHPETKAEIVLEAEKSGVPGAARLAWTSVLAEKPEAVSLAFDGRPLKLDGDGRAALPPHDLKTVHILAAELRFKGDRSVRKDVLYGGEYGSEVSTELTAVPVRVTAGTLPPPRDLRGWFTAGGKELAVDALENGQAQLFVVRVPSEYEDRQKLGSRGLAPEPNDVQIALRLDKDARIRLVPPYTERVEGKDQETDLFVLPHDVGYEDGGLLWLIRGKPESEMYRRLQRMEQKPVEHELRIADAVAVAGLQALAENRRRAVLLVLKGDEREDTSDYTPEEVRRFLAAIHVPLFVWTLGKAEPGSQAMAWGPSQRVDAFQPLERATSDLRQALLDQRVVLVEGRYLPQSLALGPAARGVELVAGGHPE